jgi:HTH-type transcriptional regulator / antitoxin HipB
MRTLIQSPQTLGRALRDVRRRSRLTQQQVADLAGIAQPTLSNIERGSSSVTLSTLLRLLATLRLELSLQQRKPTSSASPWEDA